MSIELTVTDAELHRSIKLAVLAELMRLESDTIAREVTDAELGDIADNVLRVLARHRADATAPLVEALRMAHRHIQHQAAWIGKQNAGYSFEALGEDMPTIEAALAPYKATTHD